MLGKDHARVRVLDGGGAQVKPAKPGLHANDKIYFGEIGFTKRNYRE
jgi:hypothetical protein